MADAPPQGHKHADGAREGAGGDKKGLFPTVRRAAQGRGRAGTNNGREERAEMAAAGRPRKYGSKKALSEAVERYFGSISRTVTARDDKGREIRNDNGEPIRIIQYVRPPSISGLCLYLGIDRSTWQNYCDEKQHPEFRDVTTQTRGRIEAWLEEQLLTREKSVQGIIFNLQNNYGWRQKQEVELGEKTRGTVSAESLSIKEKLALLAEAQAARAAALEQAGEED